MDDVSFNLNTIGPRLDAASQAAIIEANPTAAGLSNEAQHVMRSDRLDESIALHLQALDLKQRACPKLSIQTVITLNALGKTYLRAGRLEEAQELLLKALKVKADKNHWGLGLGPRLDAATTRENVAALREAQGNFDDARVMRLNRTTKGEMLCGNYNACKSVFYCGWDSGVPGGRLEKPSQASLQGSYSYCEVIVVLSNAVRSVLEQMRTSDHLDSIHLDLLEREEWVSRAWTYQEAVNSGQNLFITCEDTHGAIVHGSHFLNCLGYTFSRLGSSDLASDKRQRYPRLDAFEDLIADYMISGYQERSALQVMSNMDRRIQRRREDHFYAMIGAISTVRASDCETSDPCEAFMLVCERKGDYSFIYSAVKRDSTPFRRWRPVSGDLPSILPWHSFGEGQPAHKESEFLYLDQMMLLENHSMDREGEKFVEEWLDSNKIRGVGSPKSVQESMHAALQFMGFKGSPDCISTTHGLFFPWQRISDDEETTILVATQLRWTFGAPGIARSYRNAELYTPGVFFGRIDNAVATSVKMS
ncbi:hypothetical protein DL770_004073 [Monosporascus sp. CRB-9-2]|nr:hypothetical protein DL770_004073 [Monosporascus sp. CRB-9-2]